MATAAIAHPRPSRTSSAPLLPIFWRETNYEFLKLLRTRSFSLAIIGFPVMFYVLFGIANRSAFSGGIHIAKYMLAGYACFGLIGAALFGIGAGLAGEIAAGWLELKRASPMPAPAYLFAKCASAVAFGTSRRNSAGRRSSTAISTAPFSSSPTSLQVTCTGVPACSTALVTSSLVSSTASSTRASWSSDRPVSSQDRSVSRTKRRAAAAAGATG